MQHHAAQEGPCSWCERAHVQPPVIAVSLQLVHAVPASRQHQGHAWKDTFILYSLPPHSFIQQIFTKQQALPSWSYGACVPAGRGRWSAARKGKSAGKLVHWSEVPRGK